MKILKNRDLVMYGIVVSLAVVVLGCGYENPILIPRPTSTANAENTPPVSPTEIHQLEDGKTFVREGGWPIPSFDGAERLEFETFIPSSDGRSLKVYRTVIEPPLLFIPNPLHLIGMPSTDILIHKVVEYRTSSGIFCYKFLVNDAEVDASTKEVRSSRGLLYSYIIYDEDGNGIFESLIINEMDRMGRSGFEGEPHLPKWTLK